MQDPYPRTAPDAEHRTMLRVCTLILIAGCLGIFVPYDIYVSAGREVTVNDDCQVLDPDVADYYTVGCADVATMSADHSGTRFGPEILGWPVSVASGNGWLVLRGKGTRG